MSSSPYFKKPLSKYNNKHLPLKVFLLIKLAGLTKPQFFEKFPTFDYRKEPFPKVLIDKIKIKRKLRESRLKQAHRDLARNVERLSLRSPKRLEKLRRKVEFLPSTSQVVRPVAKVMPRACSPYPRIDIDLFNDPIEVPLVDNPPSVENPSYNWEEYQPPSILEIQPPSIQEIAPPSPFPDVEIIPPPSVEFIPQVE